MYIQIQICESKSGTTEIHESCKFNEINVPLGSRLGRSQSFVSNLINDHVTCRCRLCISLSPVNSKKCLCPLSILRNAHFPSRYIFKARHMSLGLMSPVEFKKRPSRRVDFRGLVPYPLTFQMNRIHQSKLL